jgi:hypothetical protein
MLSVTVADGALDNADSGLGAIGSVPIPRRVKVAHVNANADSRGDGGWSPVLAAAPDADDPVAGASVGRAMGRVEGVPSLFADTAGAASGVVTVGALTATDVGFAPSSVERVAGVRWPDPAGVVAAWGFESDSAEELLEVGFLEDRDGRLVVVVSPVVDSSVSVGVAASASSLPGSADLSRVDPPDDAAVAGSSVSVDAAALAPGFPGSVGLSRGDPLDDVPAEVDEVSLEPVSADATPGVPANPIPTPTPSAIVSAPNRLMLSSYPSTGPSPRRTLLDRFSPQAH